MYRLLIVAFLLCSPLAWAQDADEDEPAQPAEEAADAEADEATDDLDDLDLGDLYPVEDEDVFIPSEDVAFGQSIPFPTDI